MGREKPSAREEDPGVPQGKRGKPKKKGMVIDDDEYGIGTEPCQEGTAPEERAAPVGDKKKSKKGSKNNNLANKILDVKNAEDEDNNVLLMQFSGKKKSNSNKGGDKNVFASSGFELLGEGDMDVSHTTRDEDLDFSAKEKFDLAFKGMKKSSKSKKGMDSSLKSSAFDDKNEDGELDIPVSKPQSDIDGELIFQGKKTLSKSSNKKTVAFSFGGLEDIDDEKEEEDEVEEKDDDDDAEFTSYGKKKTSSKSSKKSSHLLKMGLIDDENVEEDTYVSALIGSEEDGDASVITFSGKKKSSKKKNYGNALEASIEPVDIETKHFVTDTSKRGCEDLKNNIELSKDVSETSKNKKKKKSGRTAQEEDDVEKILAELGEGPSDSNPAPAFDIQVEDERQIQCQPDEKKDAELERESEGGGTETAARKKNKKKKEKEKQKKAAALLDGVMLEETKNKTKIKTTEKKVSRQVKEMQEQLARVNEEKERKRREEEEVLRKEEEERKRLEELERLEEERKRAKKQREREKLLKKKMEGKLLTGKQKEEAKRREAMRNQIIAKIGGWPLPTGDASDAPSIRPKYETKKFKLHKCKINGVASESSVECKKEAIENPLEDVSEVVSMEPEKVEDVDTMSMKDDKEEAATMVEENGKEEYEDEWDAKSWDDADLKLPTRNAFADEEEYEYDAKLAEKVVAFKPVQATVLPIKPQDVQGKRSLLFKEVSEKNKQKDHLGTTGLPNRYPQPNEGESNLRSPICCIMGHVDTGKTKLLDCIRGTNVQEGEAGGITQQIGATYFPTKNIRERTMELKADAKLKVPGLLVIDTPGHESFTNLRSRGSGLCDIAILVVDIMHGLEPQTIESLNLLKMRNTEFIVALNKVDRLYGWKTCKNAPIVKAMKQQTKDVQFEFNRRLTQIITQFKEQGLNTELYYKNKDTGDTYNIVPTSAISGEGVPDMLLWLVQWTQKTMVERLTYSNDIQCTVLEVKVVEGHGTTIDVILVNGILHEGDQIVVCGMQGPIVTTIRALLTPHPMKELRVKGNYLHHKEIKAAQGIKITAQGLEHAIAGTSLYVVGADDDINNIKESSMEDMKSVLSRIDKTGEGVCVQASTLGSLEALLEFLKSPAVNIPVSGISIGPVHKKDVMKASVMLEKNKEYATILAFDVKVTPEARELADEAGVKIFMADIIYHLFDQFKAYIDTLKEEKKKEAADDAVFPCLLRIAPGCCFNKKDPIILGVEVLEGILKVGTPICLPSKNFMDLGRVASIQIDKKVLDFAKKGGQSVAIKLIATQAEEQQRMFGRHFDETDELVSRISRKSIDVLKANYRDEVSKDEWVLVKKLKALFKIT